MTAPAAAMPDLSGLSVYVAMPLNAGRVGAWTTASLCGLVACLRQAGADVAMSTTTAETLLPRARSVLLARFLLTENTHLLWVDPDAVFDAGAVLSMLASGRDVVAGAYPAKAVDWARVDASLSAASSDEPPARRAQAAMLAGTDFEVDVEDGTGVGPDGLVPVRGVGMGLMLVTRAAAQGVVDAWRDRLLCSNPGGGGGVQEYVAVFDCLMEPYADGDGGGQHLRWLGEDHSLCRRLAQGGTPVCVDARLWVGREGVVPLHGDIRERLPAAATAPTVAA